MSSIKEIVKVCVRFVDKNSPTILAIATSLFAAGSVVLAVKDTPKAMEIIKEENETREAHDMPPMTKTETAMKCAKVYLPTAGVFVLSTGANVLSHRIQAKRIAALTSAYLLSTDQFKRYKEKVAENLSGAKIDKIKGDIAQDKLNESVENGENTNVIDTHQGTTLCYDSYTGRYFKSSIGSIEKGVNEANMELLRSDFFSLNELYYLWKLGETKLGDDLGWSSRDGLIDVHFSSKLTPEGIIGVEAGQPCMVIEFGLTPKSSAMIY